jgi:hypothetical protein
MPKGEAKIFECVECTERYSKLDAERRRYFPLTKVCRNCYRKMAKAQPKIWCFGKEASGRLPGYSTDNEVCQKVCPDKEVCLQFINRRKGE